MKIMIDYETHDGKTLHALERYSLENQREEAIKRVMSLIDENPDSVQFVITKKKEDRHVTYPNLEL